MWWAFHWMLLRAAKVQFPRAETSKLGEYCPGFQCCSVLQCWMIAVWDEWWDDRESGTYPINSGMSRVFYLPQHRALSTRHPLALRRMRSTGCWVSADESQFWKFFGSSPGVWTKAFSAAGGGSTTRPLSCKYEDLQAACVRWLILYDCFQEFNSDVCYFLECVSTHKKFSRAQILFHITKSSWIWCKPLHSFEVLITPWIPKTC